MARGGSRIGSKVPLPDYAHFTHAAEIAGRNSQTVVLEPTTFIQAGPSDSPGMNRAAKSMKRKTGDFKFTHMG
jgi:hypothetical protein